MLISGQGKHLLLVSSRSVDPDLLLGKTLKLLGD